MFVSRLKKWNSTTKNLQSVNIIYLIIALKIHVQFKDFIIYNKYWILKIKSLLSESVYTVST